MSRSDAGGTRHWVFRSEAQWLRSDHQRTALADEVVMLARGPRQIDPVIGDPARLRYGVTWDNQGYLYRSVPAEGRIERIPPPEKCPAPPAPSDDISADENPCSSGQIDEVPPDELQPDGTTISLEPPPLAPPPSDCRVTYLPAPLPGCEDGALRPVEPRGLAIDGLGRLYVADAGAGRVYVIDLLAGRLISSSGPPPLLGRTPRPWDVFAAPKGPGAYLLDRGTRSVWRIFSDRGPQQLLGLGGAWENPGEESLHDPTALWVTPQGAVVVLDRIAGKLGEPTTVSIIWAWPRAMQRAVLGRGSSDLQIPDATAIAMDDQGDLYVAGAPDGSILRFNVESNGPDDLCLAFHLVTALATWQFDGGSLTRDPCGAIVHTVPEGVRPPTPAFPSYGGAHHDGVVTTFGLDSGIPDCVWHRIYFEACLPEHTSLEIATRTADDADPDDPSLINPHPPQGYEQQPPAGKDEPKVFAPDAPSGWIRVPWLLCRPGGADRPFYTPQYEDGRSYALYEGLVLSPPGRNLWVRITLRGTDRVTPFVRGLRVYYPRPSYLRYLPSTYREDARAADFLDRFLSLFEVFYSELDEVRDHLAVLFDPMATPTEALDWLAGWLGMVFDSRWPESKRRRLLLAAARLYRRRGTLDGLTEILSIYLDQPFRILESFRLQRGGDFYLGEGKEFGNSVLGKGIVLKDKNHSTKNNEKDPSDGNSYAHQFEVTIVGSLSDEQLAIVKQILELEKPAHTKYQLCVRGETMSVGQRALLGISTLILRAPQGMQGTILGTWRLGMNGLLGGPDQEKPGVFVGKSLIGRNTTLR